MPSLIPVNDSPFDSIRRVREDGSEYWSARDLMPLDMAKTVCTLHGAEKARELRRFLIESDERGEKPRFDNRKLTRDELFLVAAKLQAEKVELEAEVEKLKCVNDDLRDLINRMLERGL